MSFALVSEGFDKGAIIMLAGRTSISPPHVQRQENAHHWVGGNLPNRRFCDGETLQFAREILILLWSNVVV